MKKFMELLIDMVVMFAVIMLAADKYPAVNNLMFDIIYWLDMEKQVSTAVIGLSAVTGCVVFAIENVLFALIYDAYRALRTACTATKKHFERKAA